MHSLLRLSSAVHLSFVFNQIEHEASNVVKTLRHLMPEQSDSMKWRVMTQYKEGFWLRWPLNVARHARLQSSVLKKLFPLNLSMLDKWLIPALLALVPYIPNIPASVHVTSLFSHYLSPWGKTHNMSSEQQHHAMLWCVDVKMPGNIYQNIAHHYEVLLGPRVDSGKLLESTLKNWCFS